MVAARDRHDIAGSRNLTAAIATSYRPIADRDQIAAPIGYPDRVEGVDAQRGRGAASRAQTSADPVALVEAYQRTFNERDLDAWAALLDREVEIHVETVTLRGIEAALGYAQHIDQVFPGIRSETVRVVASVGDTVVCDVRSVNPNAGSRGPDAWHLEGLTCCASRSATTAPVVHAPRAAGSSA
jgi:hypothetical protein